MTAPDTPPPKAAKKRKKPGRPPKHPAERRDASLRIDVTTAQKLDIAAEAEIQGVSIGEWCRRRFGIGQAVPGIRDTASVIGTLESRGIDVAELLSREGIRAQAEEAGIDEAVLIRRMLEFAAAPVARRTDAALVSEINRLGLELMQHRFEVQALGKNVNQLAYAENRRMDNHSSPLGGETREIWSGAAAVVRQVSEQSADLCARLEAALEKVLGDD